MTAVLATASTSTDPIELEPDQMHAAILLASGMALGKVAQQVGVDRRTLFYWRQCPTFAVAFERELAAQTQLIREAVHARLLGLAERALDVVESALDSGGSAALSAARVVLARAEAPPPPPMPTAEEVEQQAEAARQRSVQVRLSHMSDEELCAEIERLRAQGDSASETGPIGVARSRR